MTNFKQIFHDMQSMGYSANCNSQNYDMYFPKRIDSIVKHVFRFDDEVKKKISFRNVGFLRAKNSWSFKFDNQLETDIKNVTDVEKAISGMYYRTFFNEIKDIIKTIDNDVIVKLFPGFVFSTVFEIVVADSMATQVPGHYDENTFSVCLKPFGRGTWLGNETVRYTPSKDSVLFINGKEIEKIIPEAKPLLHGSILDEKNINHENFAIYIYYTLAE